MNNSEHAYRTLVESGALTKQQEEILQCFNPGQVLSTHQIKELTSIDRVNTIGARVGELVRKGLLVGVGSRKHGGRPYSTFRLAKDKAEVAKFASYSEQAARLQPLRKVLDGNYSKTVKLVVEKEIDRINHLNDVA